MNEDKVKVKLTRTVQAGARGETSGTVEQECVVEMLESEIPENGVVVSNDVEIYDWRIK